MVKEYIIHESDLPWWFYLIHPFEDWMTMSHYGYLCYEIVPKVYRNYAKEKKKSYMPKNYSTKYYYYMAK